MKKTLSVVFLAIGLLAAQGCVQMPTEKHGVADMRPQISFKVTEEKTFGARVLIDGLDMGAVGDYLNGSAALRVLPGSHVLIVVLGGQRLLEEKFYIGDGVVRTFNLK